MILLGIFLVIVGAIWRQLSPLVTVGLILVVAGVLLAFAGHPAY